MIPRESFRACYRAARMVRKGHASADVAIAELEVANVPLGGYLAEAMVCAIRCATVHENGVQRARAYAAEWGLTVRDGARFVLIWKGVPLRQEWYD